MLPGVQRVQRVWGSEPSHSQVNSHVGSWWELESQKDSRNFREHFEGSKLHGLLRSLYQWKSFEVSMSKMGSHCSFGHLKHKLWPKEGPGVEGPGVELPGVRRFWLPTTKSRESTRNTWLQRRCDILLERSRRDLQLCFRQQLNRRSDPKVMGLQSPGSPARRDFGTPARESRDKKAIWMPLPRRVTEYTIGSKVVAYSQARGVVCQSESEFTRGTKRT
jgi:hypothetical protein